MTSDHPGLDVVVIGRSCLDEIGVVERFPHEDTKAPLLWRTREGGGQGGTAACCITRLGGQVRYWGRIGDDEAGRFCLRRLHDFHVSLHDVEIVPCGQTPTAFVFITESTGCRTILYDRNTLPPLTATYLPFLLDPSPPIILLDPEVTGLIAEIKRQGPSSSVVYDCERWHPAMNEAMTMADYFVPSADFLSLQELALAHLPFPEQIRTLASKVRGTLIVTQGENGAYYLEDGKVMHVSVPQVDVLDTTGAGDNFHAALSLALARGFSLREAVTLAVAVASLSCRAYGGRLGIPTWDEALAIATNLPVLPL